ncbi:AAA family ATPase [soil metagenome]
MPRMLILPGIALVDLDQLKAAIVALEAQRGKLGDAVIDLALGPLIAQRDALETPAELRLRQITVLFADIVGSTAIGERLDPEDVAAVVGLALERFGQVVKAHGGRVLRYTGDGLKGVFGVDGNADDGPAAAVRAALGMTDAARLLEPDFRARYALEEFRIRVGVNTGVAAIGAGIEAGNTAIGTTVNLASRIEQAAPPGSVLIGQDTQRHIRDRFELIERKPIHVKGHDAPLATWIVQRERARSFVSLTRGRNDARTALIGRDDSLQQLLDAARIARTERKPVMVTIAGEAGIGKSRLLREMLGRIGASRPMLASAYAFNRLVPYAVLRDLLAAALGIAETDSASVAHDKLLRGFGTSVGSGATAQISRLAGFDTSADADVDPTRTQPDARGLRDGALRALGNWLALRGRQEAPLVMVVDDLHWADDASIDWVQQLTGTLAGVPVLLVVTARPTLLESRSAFARGQIVLELAPLDQPASLALADAMLSRLSPVPPRLRERLARDAGGNPFYMEELLRMLLDDGAIVVERAPDGSERWRTVDERLDINAVPPTLTGVLQARLDSLELRDRLAIQQASVIGPVFWNSALDALSPSACGSLAELMRRDLVHRREGSSFAGSVEYGFVHPLLHQVTYDTVLKVDRRTGHSRTAAWLSAQPSDRASEHLASTAEHFARAGDRANAAAFFMRAANDARLRFANQVAMDHAVRALELLELDAHESRFNMHNLRWNVSDLLGQRDVQTMELQSLSTHADESGSLSLRARAAMQRAMHAERGSEYDLSLVDSQLAAELATAGQQWEVAARGWAQTAWIQGRRAQHAAARTSCAQALDFARRSGDRLVQAQILAVAAEIETHTNDLHRVIALRREVIAMIHGYDFGARLEAIAHGGVAIALLDVGDRAGAHSSFLESQRISLDIGLRSAEAFALVGLARIHLESGRAEDALTLGRQALVISESAGDRYRSGTTRRHIGDTLLMLERYADAEACYRESIDLFEALDLTRNVAETRLRLAECALAVGDLSTSLDWASMAMNEPQLVEDADDSLRARRILYQICTAVGDGRATGWLAASRVQIEAACMRMPDDDARALYRAREAVAWVLATDASLTDTRELAA